MEERRPVRVYVSSRTAFSFVSGFGDDPWHIAAPAYLAADTRDCRTLCGLMPDNVYQGASVDARRWRHCSPNARLSNYTLRSICTQCFPREERAP